MQLPTKIITYELSLIQVPEMHYRIKEKMNEVAVCNLLVVCSNNLVLCEVSTFTKTFSYINLLYVIFVNKKNIIFRRQDYNVYHLLGILFENGM